MAKGWGVLKWFQGSPGAPVLHSVRGAFGRRESARTEVRGSLIESRGLSRRAGRGRCGRCAGAVFAP